MLSLKDKLGLYHKSETGNRPAPTPAVLPGFSELSNEFGTCLYREISLPTQRELVSAGDHWSLLGHDQRLTDFNPEQAAYLDLETNGLYLGAGAFAFLMGLGLVRNGKPYLFQLFLRDPRDERAALMEAAERLQGRSLVTYNGKCFDWPLLVDRFRFHRLPVPVVGSHLDMLFPARRLYRQDLSRCGLKEVEHHVLGVTRIGDIDGALIPAAYNRFLREGYSEEISVIIDHNALDICSLFELTLYCGNLYIDNCFCQREGELMGVVRSCLQAGNYEQARRYLPALVEQRGRCQAEGFYLLGMISKREQDWKQALYWWEQAAMSSPLATTPLVEMAKYYEHIEHDWVQAHALTYQAIQNAMQLKKQVEIKALAQRISRLNRKMELAKGG